MLLTTLLRELTTPERLVRVPEAAAGMDSAEAVSAFLRAGRPGGILSGVYAFYIENACRMIRPGDRVLDLGCGPAVLLHAISERNPQAHFTGIDLSPRMIEAAAAQLSRLRPANASVRLDDMTTLATFAPGSIDVVLCSMALHHLPCTAALRNAFLAIQRVMAPGARLFMADFGRLKSIRSVEYFVRRAIPPGEPVLYRDYLASLRAAFSREEFAGALPERLSREISIYSTIVSPMMIVLMSPFPDRDRKETAVRGDAAGLPHNRLADYRQLRLCLRLGGMPCR